MIWDSLRNVKWLWFFPKNKHISFTKSQRESVAIMPKSINQNRAAKEKQ